MSEPASSRSYEESAPALTPLRRVPPDFGIALSPPLTSFIGREREVAQITALLMRDGRLVTLVGPGGVGKTRLALAVATDIYPAFRQGAACISLANLPGDGDLILAIASELGVRQKPGEELFSTLTEWIGERQMLLLLDNFEHLTASAPKVQELLGRCPALAIIATSRSPLRISVERTVLVDPFPVPDIPVDDRRVDLEATAANSAVQLYVDRASAADPRFSLTATNAGAVVDVCRWLDGLPLAIELAAAHANVLSPAAMLARLDKRLQLLSGGPADQPARLQTIRQTIAWSYELLSPEARRVFRALGVFTGGARLDACEAVCAATSDDATDLLAVLRELVDQQLVGRTEELNGEYRFTMLQTILAFSREQLELLHEWDAVAGRHAEQMLAFAAGIRQGFEKADRDKELLRRFDVEFANLRAAFDWLLGQGDGERAVRLATGVFNGWHQLGRANEGIAWVNRALEHVSDHESDDGLYGLTTLSSLHFVRGDLDVALAYCERVREIATRTGSDKNLATALVNIGAIYNHMGEGHRSLVPWDEALAIRRRLDETDAIATIQCNAGMLQVATGDLADGRTRLTEAYRCWQRIGSKSGMCDVTGHLAQLAIAEEDFSLARQLLQRQVELARDLDDVNHLGWALFAYGIFLVDRGEYDKATLPILKALKMTSDGGLHYDYVSTCDAAFMLAARTNRGALAALIAGHSAHQRAIGKMAIHPFDQEQHDRDLALARSCVDPKEFSAAWKSGELRGPGELLEELTQAFTVDQPLPLKPAPLPNADVTIAAMPLSGREMDVLQLLTEGRSDREISELLFISRKTASQHVSSILRKLGVTSRAAAIAMAYRQGIT